MNLHGSSRAFTWLFDVWRKKPPGQRAQSTVSVNKCEEELRGIVDGCEKVLRVLNRVLEKYNALGEKERSAKKTMAERSQ